MEMDKVHHWDVRRKEEFGGGTLKREMPGGTYQHHLEGLRNSGIGQESLKGPKGSWETKDLGKRHWNQWLKKEKTLISGTSYGKK